MASKYDRIEELKKELKAEVAAGINLRASLVRSIDMRDLRIEGLKFALTRLASPEAFVLSRATNEEDRARMRYAEAALAFALNSVIDNATLELDKMTHDFLGQADSKLLERNKQHRDRIEELKQQLADLEKRHTDAVDAWNREIDRAAALKEQINQSMSREDKLVFAQLNKEQT